MCPPASASLLAYNAPKKPSSAKPYQVFLHRIDGNVSPVAVAENNAPKAYKSADDIAKAQEQALLAALALGGHVAVTTDGTSDLYIDVQASANAGQLCFFDESRDLIPPCWKASCPGRPQCLKTLNPSLSQCGRAFGWRPRPNPKRRSSPSRSFFNFKFLSDNLPRRVLPEAYSFYAIRKDAAEMMRLHGMTAIVLLQAHPSKD